MNKANEGMFEEIIVTKYLNKNKEILNIVTKNQSHDYDDLHVIHIIRHKLGLINQQFIKPKADVFLAQGFISKNILSDCDYYLNEDDFDKFNLKFVENSGISIKLSNSNYTISKVSPPTFFKLFQSNLLAVGASIYTTKNLNFNENILIGWGVNLNDFLYFFAQLFNFDGNILENQQILKKIKTYSNNEIVKIIVSNNYISDFLFKGTGNFNEPFTAQFIFENNELKHNMIRAFTVTTGSGRSKGVYTIVLKPK